MSRVGSGGRGRPREESGCPAAEPLPGPAPGPLPGPTPAPLPPPEPPPLPVVGAASTGGDPESTGTGITVSTGSGTTTRGGIRVGTRAVTRGSATGAGGGVETGGRLIRVICRPPPPPPVGSAEPGASAGHGFSPRVASTRESRTTRWAMNETQNPHRVRWDPGNSKRGGGNGGRASGAGTI